MLTNNVLLQVLLLVDTDITHPNNSGKMDQQSPPMILFLNSHETHGMFVKIYIKETMGFFI